MKIFNENMVLMENPDLTKGRIEQAYRPITHRYKITQEEVGHYEVVKEYSNGGKDMEFVIDVPEKGHWITYDINGKEIECDNIVPGDAPHETPIYDQEVIGIYIPYTEEELNKMVEEDAQPTEFDILEAQVTYTAMMTDTLLEV